MSYRAENCSHHHKINKNLYHIEHKRSDLSNSELFFAAEFSANPKNSGHGSEYKKIGKEVEEPIPDSLNVSLMINLLISNFKPCNFFSFSCKGFDCPDIRKCLLCLIRNFCFFILYNLLGPLHCISIIDSKNHHRNDRSYHNKSQLPRNDKNYNQRSNDKDDCSNKHGNVCRKTFLDNCNIRPKSTHYMIFQQFIIYIGRLFF